ncbi:ATP-citrate lyase beta-subunit [Elusimicrobium simillimum]|uniref:ATP citrate lyase citrate-binding domain-containing protein n=1 Tax=Elusimicrobium simillimum TaxID=3143438 RepID=UPI003C700735
MAIRGIREYDGKKVLFTYLGDGARAKALALVTPTTKERDLLKQNPWLTKAKLVAKPDQLFGKRGKHGLLCVGKSFKETWKWIQDRMNKKVTVGSTIGTLTHFLIEPFTPHKDEYYAAIKSTREGDTIYISNQGGIYVEENWDKIKETFVPVLGDINKVKLNMPDLGANKTQVENFVKKLYGLYIAGGFSYLEINPFTFDKGGVVPLDLVAKVDDTSLFETGKLWGDLEFPAAFGSHTEPEEEYIKELDEKTGASLKLTILNRKGRVWTMVAGGGASVIYADTVCDLGFSKELANYGEYSGDPSKEFTYLYAKTVLDLATKERHPKGKVLIIGGGIANFTDVAKTFEGIIQALEEYAAKIKKNNIKIFVRRGGPNYEEGLANMRRAGERLGLNIEVFGPDTHITRIVSLALEGGK